MILDHFGHETVAEVTGRGRRFIIKVDEKTGERRRMEESRPAPPTRPRPTPSRPARRRCWCSPKPAAPARPITPTTPRLEGRARAHYLLQGGWRADKAVQGFGRTHRTNQASAPIVSLVTTDLQGQKRFISSIARRLSQLGALTKGQRQAGDQGIFSARDNLESTEAHQALRSSTPTLAGASRRHINEFEEQTGLKLRKKDEEGRSSGMAGPAADHAIPQSAALAQDRHAERGVRRVLDRLDAVIEARAQAGLLDAGLETVKADKIEKVSERRCTPSRRAAPRRST
jgi:hypothetical protein